MVATDKLIDTGNVFIGWPNLPPKNSSYDFMIELNPGLLVFKKGHFGVNNLTADVFQLWCHRNIHGDIKEHDKVFEKYSSQITTLVISSLQSSLQIVLLVAIENN